VPQLSIDAFRPNWLADIGTVVLDKNRVVAVSAFAQSAGVQLGMRSSSVQILLPDAQIRQRDSECERAALQTVALALLQYSPQVVVAEQASVLINVGASLRLFGGVRHLCRHVMKTMAALGMRATLGCAATARAAWLFAHAVARNAAATSLSASHPRSGKYCLSLKKLPHQLDRLVVSLLPAAEPWLSWLQGIGCHQLGALRQLPRAGLQRRCGKTLLHSMDCAYGEATELYPWLEAPPEFNARAELPDRIEHADAILGFARILLLQLCGWLSSKQLAITKFQLQLEHERGRQAIAPTLLEINLAEATWREEHLSRLLKEHLAQLKLDAPVIVIRLHAMQVEAMQAPSASLFPEPGGSKEEQHRLLELLVARLGAENVLQAAPQMDHRPEIANTWVSVMSDVAQKRKLSNSSNLPHKTNKRVDRPMDRPVWLLAKALPLKVHQHRPFYGSALKLMSPAERIEAGWWNGQLVTRDYFIAENAEHVRCWIYRERINQLNQNETDAAWFLHGLFG
jgi:protein ImuB